VYKLVRDVVSPGHKAIFRAGNDLLLEQYLDGVEFDVDLVLQDGQCVFSSVSQNWPTAEPSFQETGLHLPPNHNKKAVAGLVDLSVQTVQAFGFRRGVLHVEGKCTSRGPRVIEVNARMGGARIHQMVEAVWGVDLIEAQLRSCLDLPQALKPSRRPRCAVVNAIVYAPATGRLAGLPFAAIAPESGMGLELDHPLSTIRPKQQLATKLSCFPQHTTLATCCRDVLGDLPSADYVTDYYTTQPRERADHLVRHTRCGLPRRAWRRSASSLRAGRPCGRGPSHLAAG